MSSKVLWGLLIVAITVPIVFCLEWLWFGFDSSYIVWYLRYPLLVAGCFTAGYLLQRSNLKRSEEA